MKKQILLVFIFLGLLMTFSCEKKEAIISNEDKLLSDLMSIEMQVYSDDFKVIKPEESIVNTDFFKAMDRLRNTDNLKERDEAIRYLNGVNSKSDETDIEPEEEAIFKSYISVLAGKTYEEKLSISDIYISDIEALSISTESKENAIEKIIFYRDLNVYVNSFSENPENIKGEDKWNCRFHPCVECCIIARLEAIEGNPVLFFHFLINIGGNLAVYGLSCVWDCVV